MTSKHTPALEVLKIQNTKWMPFEIVNGESESIAFCRDEKFARLIAAAPELLAALKAIVSNYDIFTSHEVDTQEISDARAAIAKAEGRL